MSSRISKLLLFTANVLIPLAILIFAKGFFPYKPFLSGLAQYEALGYQNLPEAPFDKVVFMVVDALRSDFVFSELSGFTFTQSLIRTGVALPFTAHATAPTITMPRIKAITTGSIPSFLDVILNFAESDTSSTLATQDTWLAQIRAKGTGKMVMYGDDTWLKLFPENFDRADGTSSFFVADFTEVDNNVTRHVPEELKNDDWNTMVLHYLGLDHIGHKAGPRSPNMIPKQREMDAIVSQIYEAMTTSDHLKSTLLVLCGDHGMNDAGNHGGSTPGETSPALVFISPKFKEISQGLPAPAAFQDNFQYYSTVEQSDIAPTLGALLGFPAPRNNLGAMIPHFLPFWKEPVDRVQIMLRNARQILHIVTATFPSFENPGPSEKCGELPNTIDDLACQWKVITRSLPNSTSKDSDYRKWQNAMEEWLKQTQALMSSTVSNYSIPKLVTGQCLAIIAFVFASVAAGRTITTKSFRSCLPFLLIVLFYGIMMFASSYVEEEQHFWYWTTATWQALLWIKCYRKHNLNSNLLAFSSIAILASTRLSRRWNQTGQKFAGETDIARTFFSQHKITFWLLVGITYLRNLQCLVTRVFSCFPQILAAAAGAILTTGAITFKLAFTHEDSPELMNDLATSMADRNHYVSLVTRARIVFISIAAALIYTIASGFRHPKRINPTMRAIHDLLTLFLITQSRATNIPLLLLFEIQLHLLDDLQLNLVEITTTSLLLQYSSFFAFGGSNAISSIDLSSSYNGVSGYNVLAVGILTFVSNWTGPIFWTSATSLMLLRLRSRGGDDGKGGNGVLRSYLSLQTVFVTASLVGVMAACTALRTHLFIWTVFSPKYLYSMAWAMGQHLVINVGFGSLLFWLGTKYT